MIDAVHSLPHPILLRLGSSTSDPNIDFGRRQMRHATISCMTMRFEI